MEEWKSIDEYENYKISDHGNVKNITTNKEMVTLNFPSKKNRRNDAPYINVGGKLIK